MMMLSRLFIGQGFLMFTSVGLVWVGALRRSYRVAHDPHCPNWICGLSGSGRGRPSRRKRVQFARCGRSQHDRVGAGWYREWGRTKPVEDPAAGHAPAVALPGAGWLQPAAVLPSVQRVFSAAACSPHAPLSHGSSRRLSCSRPRWGSVPSGPVAS